MQSALFLTSKADPEPADAVAAILLDARGRYFLQLRDDLPQIFFPAHWGCFGGAINPGEQPVAALVRELREELELEVEPGSARLFTRFDFDFAPLGKKKVFRIYYQVEMSDEQVRRLRLHEGREVRAFDGQRLLLGERVTPYDSFAIWMHMRAAQRGLAQTRVAER